MLLFYFSIILFSFIIIIKKIKKKRVKVQSEKSHPTAKNLCYRSFFSTKSQRLPKKYNLEKSIQSHNFLTK